MQGAHNEHLQKCQRWKLWVFAQLITLVSSTRTYNPPFKYEDIQYSDTWLWSWMYLKAELKTFMLQLQSTNIWKLNERAEIKTPEQSKQIIVGWLSRFIENSDDLLKVSGRDWFVQTEYFLPYEILGAVLPWLKNEGFCLHRNKVAPLSKLIKAPCSCGFCELLWCWESYFEHCQSNSSLIFHCTIYLSGKMPFCFSTHSLKTHHILFCLTFPPKLSF